jgi:hypothetical protein
MVNTRTVVLYGKSLVVASLAACLADRPHLTLHHLDAATPDLARQIRLLAPDVLVFDLAAAHPDYAIALLREHPRLLLIGVDILNARTLILSGQQSEVLTIDDLEHVIESGPAQDGGPGMDIHPQGG